MTSELIIVWKSISQMGVQFLVDPTTASETTVTITEIFWRNDTETFICEAGLCEENPEVIVGLTEKGLVMQGIMLLFSREQAVESLVVSSVIKNTMTLISGHCNISLSCN